MLFKFNKIFWIIFQFEANFSYSSVNNFSSFQKEHFWSKLGINYQFVVRFMFVFLFLIFLQQVSFYFVVNDRFSYLKVCSVHYKICVLQKFIMLSFFICLKFTCRKVRENLNLSQGIFAPDMAGNSGCYLCLYVIHLFIYIPQRY